MFYGFINLILDNEFGNCFSVDLDLYKMVCSEKDTPLNISIPVVMLPKSSGDALNKLITDGKRGEPLYLSSFKVHWKSQSVYVLFCFFF